MLVAALYSRGAYGFTGRRGLFDSLTQGHLWHCDGWSCDEGVMTDLFDPYPNFGNQMELEDSIRVESTGTWTDGAGEREREIDMRKQKAKSKPTS